MKMRFWHEVGANGNEIRLGRVIDSRHVPAWCRLMDGGYEMDFAIFSSRVAATKYKIDIECDSFFHEVYPERREADSKRDDLLRCNGWTILRFEQDDIFYGRKRCADKICDTIKKLGGAGELTRLDEVWKKAKSISFADRPRKLANDLYIDIQKIA